MNNYPMSLENVQISQGRMITWDSYGNSDWEHAIAKMHLTSVVAWPQMCG